MSQAGRRGPSELPVRLLEAISERLEEGLVVVGSDHRLRFANPAARRLLASPRSSRAGASRNSVRDYRLPLMLNSCLGGGGEVVRELDDPAASLHLVVRALPVGDPGTAPVEVALLLRDETRLRRLETVRRDFVANVSHELRTPVTAIQLLVETLLGGALDDTSVAGEFVSRIGLETAHMAQMVAELIELSTISPAASRCARFPPPSTTWWPPPSGCGRSPTSATSSSSTRSTPPPPRCSATPPGSARWCATWSTTRSSSPPRAG